MQVFVRTVTCLLILTALRGPVVAAETAAPAAEQSVAPEVDRVLKLIEQREVDNLHADIQYELRYAIDDEEDKQIQRGDIWYKTGDPVGQFKVDFDKKMVRNRPRKMEETHVFDGRWYIEKQGKTRTVIRREVRAPNEKVDPYKLGEGPFPLPFGQKRDDILAEFEVALGETADDDPENTTHLILTPRKDAQAAKRFAKIHFWVVEEGKLKGLPVKVRATKTKPTGQVDSYLTITFSDIDLNAGIPDQEFQIATPDGWEEIVEPLQSPQPQE